MAAVSGKLLPRKIADTPKAYRKHHWRPLARGGWGRPGPGKGGMTDVLGGQVGWGTAAGEG